MNLAKSPASTIQILGAEKALFRALKTKHDTPKYGLIYHASLIGQATGKNKGKIARMLATKATLGLRVDALSDWGQAGEGKGEEPTEEEKASVGVTSRALVERRLRGLEGKPLKPSGVAIGPGGQQAQPAKWEIKEARKYNPDADGLDADAGPVLTNGDASAGAVAGKKRKLVEDVSESPAASKKSKAKPVAEPDSDMDDDEAEAATALTNGHKEESKEEKKKRKEEKAARKAEKAAKKAAKEAKKAGVAVDGDEEPKKKKKKTKA